jgi:hypothetical protein
MLNAGCHRGGRAGLMFAEWIVAKSPLGIILAPSPAWSPDTRFRPRQPDRRLHRRHRRRCRRFISRVS